MHALLPDAGVVLHVGCGPATLEQTPFAGLGWREIRCDIDPACHPDVLGSITDMPGVATASVDAVYSSHNIEHLYPHEVPLALCEFVRVLKPGGVALLRCPDLQALGALLAQDRLTDTAYVSAAGPVSAMDMLYGHRAALQAGHLAMAHRCGFTLRVLAGSLGACGFAQVVGARWPERFELVVLAGKQHWPAGRLEALADQLIARAPSPPGDDGAPADFQLSQRQT